MDKPIDVYARISKSEDGDVTKTDRQIADCVAELERRGLPIGKVHEDPNKSAWRKDVRRRGFEALLKRFEDGEISGCIVWSVDRLLRQPRDLEKIIDMAETRGFTVYSCFGDHDLTNPEHLTQIRVKVAFAAGESAATQRRVKRAVEAARKGGKPGAGPRSFGFPAPASQPPVSPKLIATEREAIAEGVRRYLKGGKGNGLIDIARDWNDRGIATATGGTWTAVTIRQVVSRPRNFGLVEHRGQIVSTIDGPPAADPDPERARQLYDLVTARLAATKRGRPVSDVRLLTSIAVCGACGRHLNSRTRSGKYYADGEERVMYSCLWPRGCAKVALAQPAADLAVEAFVIRRLSDPRHADQIAIQAEHVREIDQQIAELEEIMTLLDKRLTNREISAARWDTMNAPLADQLKRLQTQRDEAKSPDPTMAVAGAQATVRQRWERALTPERRAMLKAALGELTLYVDPIPDGVHWRQIKVSDRLRIE